MSVMKSKIMVVASCLALLVGVSTWSGCGSKQQTSAETKSEVTPEDIKEMVDVLGSNYATAMGADVKAIVAERLGNLGQQAKDAGAIPALTKLSKNGKASKEARAAATEALAKLNAAAPAP